MARLGLTFPFLHGVARAPYRDRAREMEARG
jgi:hypothetical protein